MSVRFGLLGAGRIGKVHAKAISSNAKAQLVAVADAFPSRRRHRGPVRLRRAQRG